MTAQPLFQFGTVALDPAPDCRVGRLQPRSLFKAVSNDNLPIRIMHYPVCIDGRFF